MKKRLPPYCLLLLAICLGLSAPCQLIATFTIPATNNTIATPVCTDLDQLTSLDDSLLVLREVNGSMRAIIPFQVEHGYHRFLWFVVQKATNPNSKRVFELLRQAQAPKITPAMAVTDENGALVIRSANKKVLQYNYRTQYPPAGVDSSFKRSGFIHPLWSPNGNVLTQINPPDHYHHVGIWNPWTDVIFQGKKVDFWNIGDKKATVRFARFIAQEKGAVYGGFKALQEHVVLNHPAAGRETIAMNEVWDIRVFNIGSGMWLWDFTSSLNCATRDTVFLEEYRYGGFGFRATSEWNNENSKVLTSEGKTRKEADASTARWCMIDGAIQQTHSGILFMSNPANYNFPEPMRVWPEDMNKRGDVFFSFSPTRNKSWTLTPGKDHVLKYRMLVYDGAITPQQAEEVWKNFANPPALTITRSKQ
jgi:hypothetical protein